MGDRQAQIKVNKCWGGMEISRHMPDCCNEVCARLSLCTLPVSLWTIIILDVCVHTRAISHGVQSLKEYIMLQHKCSRWTIDNNTQLHAKRLSALTDPIICPAKLLPVWIFWEKTRSTEFLWFFYLCVWKYSVFLKAGVISTKDKDEMKNVNSAKTICEGDSISGWDLSE